MFDIGLWNCIPGVRYSNVECHIYSLQISLLVSYFIVMIMAITVMFMSIAIQFEQQS